MQKTFDVIIIGGSYAGLSAAMALGRSLRQVLIIDSGQPCNRQTPHSHNFITQDGETPRSIANKAKTQVLQYDTVQYYNGLATAARRTEDGFEVKTETGDVLLAKKLLFTTGIIDVHNIPGAAECWGISVLHCPYCHGYEVRHKNLGVVANGEMGFEFVRLIHHWSKQLTYMTNGKSTLTPEQKKQLQRQNITVIEDEIKAFEHVSGDIKTVQFSNGTKMRLDAVFVKFPFKQHSHIPELLGCDITEQGYIKVDDFQRTTYPGVYAAGDNSSPMRSVAAATAAGNKAGAMINKDLVEEEFLTDVALMRT
jgi:thioredoxin reductase